MAAAGITVDEQITAAVTAAHGHRLERLSLAADHRPPLIVSACPQLEEADISPQKAGSHFDPIRT